MIDTKMYARKSFDVEAVRVTKENMEEVAAWCLGKMEIQKRPTKRGEGAYVVEVPYIQVEVLRALNPRQTMAFVGDWVLKSGTSFKIYSDIAFRKNFTSTEDRGDGPFPEPEDDEPAFRMLRNGEWVPMTNDDLRNILAPLIAETMQGLVHEPEETVLHTYGNDAEIKLSSSPKAPE